MGSDINEFQKSVLVAVIIESEKLRPYSPRFKGKDPQIESGWYQNAFCKTMGEQTLFIRIMQSSTVLAEPERKIRQIFEGENLSTQEQPANLIRQRKNLLTSRAQICKTFLSDAINSSMISPIGDAMNIMDPEFRERLILLKHGLHCQSK